MTDIEKLFEINRTSRLLSKSTETILGKGILYPNIEEDVEIKIRDEDRSGHLCVIGTTRVGKSRIIENIIEQDIRKGYNVAIFDPKGDVGLLNKTIQIAAETGRLKDFLFLTPIFPDHSIMIDPLTNFYMQDELVDHAISGIKAEKGNDFFIAIAQEVTQAIVSGLAVEAAFRKKNLNINFHDIRIRSDYFSLKAFGESIQMLPGSEDTCQSIAQILTSPQDFFSKVSTSLRTTLSALTTGSTGKIIGRCRVNEFIQRFERGEKVILFCNTGSLLTRRTGYILARVLVSMLQSLIGRFFASGRKLDPPLCIHLDEGHNMLYSGIQEFFNKGGGANAWIHLYTQSIAQIEAEVGREIAKSTLDNINTCLYMLVNHPETAMYVEESSPNIKKFQPMISFGGSVTLRETDTKQILAGSVLQLPKRHFYMRSYGKLYRGVTSDVKESYLNIKFPQISTLAGDENSIPEN